MSNIEKIRQEIERMLTFDGSIATSYYIGKRDAERELKSYINSRPEEKPSEDLNDEIKKFIEEYGYERGEDKLLIAIVARHFAEWQKEQMLKDAVEAKVYGYDDGSFELIASWLDIPNNSIYKDGDKVKIIIVKEDQE